MFVVQGGTSAPSDVLAVVEFDTTQGELVIHPGTSAQAAEAVAAILRAVVRLRAAAATTDG
jgi:hypothetical protein